jgi:hypothetical protein
MGKDKELKAFLAERDALFRNPNAINAIAWWHQNTDEAPLDEQIALAAVHKARLQWLDATDEMIAESMAWLEANEFGTSWRGAPPLTRTMRDAQRAALGKSPLTKS